MSRVVEADQAPAGPLTVVVGCVGPACGAVACLEALRSQAFDGQLFVYSPTSVPAELKESFPEVRFYERPGALVPEMWRDGIEQAAGAVVALTSSPMIPTPGWAAFALTEATRTGVIAGAIDPLDGIPLPDLAECLCRYTRDMTPFHGGESNDIPGDNSAYRRELLLEVHSLWADGFWEPRVNAALRDRGVPLRRDPAMRVLQGRSAGVRAFLRQRLRHGRAYGRERGARLTRSGNLLALGRAPLVPPLMVARICRELRTRGRLTLRAAATLPWLIAYNIAWAAGEAHGHADVLLAR